MAIRIRLKGPSDRKALIPDHWSFSDLMGYLPELLSIGSPPLIFKNHKIFDSFSDEAIIENLQKSFDCHFVEEKLIYTLKIEKIILTPEEMILPFSLYAEL